MVDEQENVRELLNQRFDFLHLLRSDGPLETRDIVDALDCSRSTVTRALRELRTADLIEKAEDRYVVTRTGSMATAEYQRHDAVLDGILTSQEVIESIPERHLPPGDLLVDATVYPTQQEAPFQPLERVAERIHHAETVRAYFPTLVNPLFIRILHEHACGGGKKTEVIFDPELVTDLKGQYPHLLSEMASAETCSVSTAQSNPYALILTATENSTTLSLVVYEGSSAIQGVISNDSPDAVGWGQQKFTQLAEDASPVTDDLRAISQSVPAPNDEQSGGRSGTVPVQTEDSDLRLDLPLDLQSEGFVRLSHQYFSNRPSVSPEVSWRTGFTLTEVRDGHALERHTPDSTRKRVTTTLVERLRDGSDHVVLGPPGAGKSTIAMSVACEWFEQEVGTVLYRGKGGANEFESVALLEGYLRQLDAHTLVVVEDANRTQADRIFEVIRALGGYDDVTFLLDSRTSEWYDSEHTELDPRTDAYRRESIETFVVPEFDEREYNRFIDHFQQLFNIDVEISGNELASELETDPFEIESDAPAPGTVLLLQHRLYTLRSADLSTDQTPSTRLEADVRQLYQSLLDADNEFTADLALLINLLNGAGIPVSRELFYALAPDGEYAELETAVASLEGQLLFEHNNRRGQRTEYRTFHESWSTRFLEQTLSVSTERHVQESFGRCVTSLLSLADDSEKRESIRRQFGGPTPHLNRIDADPTQWANEVIQRIFEFGRAHARLAILFGETDDTILELPEACSPFLTKKQACWRGQMYRDQGKLDRAEREVTHLLDLDNVSANASEENMKELTMRGHWELGIIRTSRGDRESADSHFQNCYEIADRLDDEVQQQSCRAIIAEIEAYKGNTQRTEEILEEILDFAETHNHPELQAVALNGLGLLDIRQGQPDKGRTKLKAVADLAGGHTFQRDMGNRTVSNALMNLSVTANQQNDFETAESYLSRAYRIVHECGFSQIKEHIHLEVGRLRRLQGEMEAAEKHLQQAHDLACENETERWVIGSLNGLAALELERGEYDTSQKYAQKARERNDDGSQVDHLSTTYRILTQLALERSQLDIAEEYLTQSRDIADSTNNQHIEADTNYLASRLAFERENFQTAKNSAQDALDTFQELEYPFKISACLRLLGLIALKQGELGTARKHLTAAHEKAQESGVVRVIAESHDALSRLEAAAGDHEATRRHLEDAATRYEELGNADRVRQLLETLIPMCTDTDRGDETAVHTMLEIAERNNLQNITEQVPSKQASD